MSDKAYTVKSLADLCPGGTVPLGLTHGIYITEDGLTRAIALCHSEAAAREVCAALTEKADGRHDYN